MDACEQKKGKIWDQINFYNWESEFAATMVVILDENII